MTVGNIIPCVVIKHSHVLNNITFKQNAKGWLRTSARAELAVGHAYHFRIICGVCPACRLVSFSFFLHHSFAVPDQSCSALTRVCRTSALSVTVRDIQFNLQSEAANAADILRQEQAKSTN